MIMKPVLIALALAVLAANTAALAAPQSPANVQIFETDMGFHFVNKDGHTLYVYDGDEKPLKSTCVAACAKNWPPLLAEPGKTASGSYSVITRDDGTRQYAYKGMPLYRFAKDAKPGDRTGDNLNNVWHVAKP